MQDGSAIAKNKFENYKIVQTKTKTKNKTNKNKYKQIQPCPAKKGCRKVL